MASRSIRWPPLLIGGRLQMTPDPDDPGLTPEDRDIELRQLIALNVQSGRSGNPFNAPDGLGVDDPAFSGQSNAERSRYSALIRAQFRRLELARRARLVGVEFRRGGENGTLIASISYENLETGGRQQLEQTLE